MQRGLSAALPEGFAMECPRRVVSFISPRGSEGHDGLGFVLFSFQSASGLLPEGVAPVRCARRHDAVLCGCALHRVLSPAPGEVKGGCVFRCRLAAPVSARPSALPDAPHHREGGLRGISEAHPCTTD